MAVRGRILFLSRLDGVLCFQAGITEGQLIGCYSRIAPAMLPHVKERNGATAQLVAIPTIGMFSTVPPMEPKKPASPKAKIPPSEATSQ